MLRGIIAGSLWGGLIGVIVLALASQLADWRDLTPALNEELAEGATPPLEPEPALSENPVVVAGADTVPNLSDDRPRALGEGAADAPAELEPDMVPPVVTVATEAPVVDVPDTEVVPLPEIAVVSSEAPEQPARQGKVIPDADIAPEIAAAPPAEPSPVETAMLDAPPSPAQPEPTAEAELGVASDALPDAPSLPKPNTASDPVADTLVDIPEAPAPEPQETPEIAQAKPATDAAAVPPSSVSAPETQTVPGAPAEPVASDSTEAPRQIIVTENAREPEVTVEERAEIAEPEENSAPSLPGAQVRRLPSIGDGVARGASTLPAVATAPAADAVEEAPETGEGPAITANAIEFDPPADKALMTVILVHEIGAPVADDVLNGIGLPLTFAVPASLPDAARVVAAYRNAGAEVVLIPDLPPRATAQDVEVSLSVTMDAVPGVVAIMDRGADGFQAERDATAAVLAQAGESGHGIITWSRGFNNAQQAAQREGVPAALIYREIESDDEAAVSQVLDQSAFRARQQGGVVTVGPATVTVLYGIAAWAEENQNAGVALAPISAVLGVE